MMGGPIVIIAGPECTVSDVRVVPLWELWRLSRPGSRGIQPLPGS
jgi:hypothetical protein